MKLSQNISPASDIGWLANEITYRRYMLNRVSMQCYFREVTAEEYILLCMCLAAERESEQSDAARIYFSTIMEQMRLTLRQTSSLIGKLRDRGFVVWSHDDTGDEGTYIVLTKAGREIALKQEKILITYYEHVIEKFGKTKFVELIQMMDQLDTIMNERIQMEEGGEVGGDE